LVRASRSRQSAGRGVSAVAVTVVI
jgi:hypothetical protein